MYQGKLGQAKVSATSTAAGRQDTRFEVTKEMDADFAVLVYREVDGKEEVIYSRPLDVSSSGIKVLSPEPLPFQERVRLEFRASDEGASFSSDAEIRWIRPKGDAWSIGFRTSERLSQEFIQKLSASGGIERRRLPRWETNQTTAIQKEGSKFRDAAMILDYSLGGLRMTVDTKVKVGDAMKIFLTREDGTEVEVVGRAKWVVTLESGSLVGIEVHQGYLTNFRSVVTQFRNAVVQTAVSNLLPFLAGVFVVISLIFFYAFL